MSKGKVKPSITVRRAGSLPTLAIPQIVDETLASKLIGDELPAPASESASELAVPQPEPEAAAAVPPSPAAAIAETPALTGATVTAAMPAEQVPPGDSAAPPPANTDVSARTPREAEPKKSRAPKSRLPPPEVFRGARAMPAQDSENSWAARHKKVMWDCPRDLLATLDDYRAKGYSKNAIITAAVRAYLGLEGD
ncbi:MAG: hypothetical protein VKI39_07775 [Synechococcus sp.]|nr:hypothetical protein [Synechococcus sp.]